MQQILRVLQTNLFEKWSLDDLLHGHPAEEIPIKAKQLSFSMKLTGHIWTHPVYKVFSTS